MQMRISFGVIVLAVLAAAPGAFAHHSTAMFDATMTTTIEGTVKTFKRTSPHSTIVLTVPYKSGPVDWTIELGGGGVSTLLQAGWTPTTVKFGDKVSIACHPLRNGDAGCNFQSMTLADGKVLGLGPGGSAPRKGDVSTNP
jgi:hypothetical protein